MLDPDNPSHKYSLIRRFIIKDIQGRTSGEVMSLEHRASLCEGPMMNANLSTL